MSEAVVLRRMDPGRNMARFYRMDIQADLFGEWCFVREWGRIGQAGQTQSRLSFSGGSLPPSRSG
jgi:predicted DNA-binding WGR domain protein